MTTSTLTNFNNPQFGSIRTLVEGNRVLFCGSDVAKALGYAKPQNAIAAHCKGALKRGILTNGGEQEMSFIPESDLYRLIIHSKLPAAERFEHWVFDEVVPSVVNHGLYATPATAERLLEDPDFIIQAMQQLKEERAQRKALEAKIAEDASKVQFAEDVDNSKNCITVGELAKTLYGKGIQIGQNKLFQLLRKECFLMSSEARWNEPYQRHIDDGILATQLSPYTLPDGTTRMRIKPMVTGKGVLFFTERYKHLKEA